MVVDNGVEGAFVTAGTQLAVAYDFSRIFVTARIDETDIDAVRPGQQVDISVDAFPDATITGTVSEIQGGAAGVFSLFPQANTSGNFQKVTQVIPVKIAISNPGRRRAGARHERLRQDPQELTAGPRSTTAAARAGGHREQQPSPQPSHGRAETHLTARSIGRTRSCGVAATWSMIARWSS